LRGTPAPFAGDDLERVGRAARGAHHDRLNDAALADRRRELVELCLGIGAAWIARIRPQEFDWHAPLTARALGRDLGLLADIADQRGEAASKSRASSFLGHGRLRRTHRLSRLFVFMSRAAPA